MRPRDFNLFSTAAAAALLLVSGIGPPAKAQSAPANHPAQDCTAGRTGALDVERLAGEADVEGDDTPLRVHLELCHSSGGVAGQLTTEFGTFSFVGIRRGAVVTGQLVGSAGRGTAEVTLVSNGAAGRFEVGDFRGQLRLKATAKNADEFLHPKENLQLTPRQWNEDLDALVEFLTTKHGSPFTYVSRSAFFAEAAEIRRGLAGRSGIANALEFRKLAAMIGDGHTQVALPKDPPVLPFQTYWFKDGIRVVAAPPGHRELLGAKLQSINGIEVGAVVDGLKPYFGQHETFNEWRRTAPLLLARIDLLNDLKITKPGSNSYVFKQGAHREKLELTAGSAQAELVRFPWKYPLWQRNPDRGWWEMPLRDGSIYINWRSYNDLPTNSAALMRQLDKHHPRRLLIDLRDNGGGDYNVGRQLIDLIVKRPWLNRKGVLYVLVGRRTFSAAMTNAVDFLTGTNATLVGETIGAKPNGWQESRSDFLPNSGLEVSVSVRHYAFLPGASEVRPNLYVSPQLSDWKHELDAAVRRIVRR